ncbi:MAG: hypothetical protein HOW73_17885 [Polyangiaceae bacterium]|nr:hypothetical protein [Polyangiaceae bacterium]
MSRTVLATTLATALTVACFATGCAPQIRAASTPPPTRSGEHAANLADDDEVRLGKGVALAFDCYEGFFAETCRDATATIDDPTVAKVFPAHLERQKAPWSPAFGSVRPRAGFVVVGVKRGRTVLRVNGSSASSDVQIIVE